MKYILCISLLCCGITLVNSQDFQAHNVIHFQGEFNGHESFHKDNMGNSYITGRGTGAIDFDMGPGSTTLPENSYQDLYIAKYDADQNLTWLRSFDGTIVSNQIRAMATDDAGNVYIGGAFSGTLDLTPDGQNELTNFGSTSMFVAKFDPEGNLLWQFKIGDTNFSQYPDAMYIVNNRLIIQFVYSGTFDVDPGPGTTMFTGSSNAMLVYGLDGSLLEANTHRGGTNVRTSAVDENGNLYIGGLFSGLATFDYKSNASVFANGFFDAYIVKYDIDFNLIWLRRVSKNSETLTFNHLAIDSNNDLLAVGNFAQNTDVGSLTAESDAYYLVNVSSDGEFEQLVEFLPESSFVSSLSINSQDQIIVEATFNEIVDVDPSNSTKELIPMEDVDNVLLAVLESDYTYTGSDQIYANELNARSIFLDLNDEISILTNFEGEGKVAFGHPDNYTAEEGENFVYYNLDLEGCTATMGFLEIESCDTIAFNNEIITVSGEYQHILMNQQGCDSIVNLTVTIFESYEMSESVESCGPYENEGIILATSGQYTLPLISIHGCDSTVFLDLSVVDIEKSLSLDDGEISSNENDGDAYQWYDCTTELPIENETSATFSPQNDGSYKVEITKHSCVEFSECIDFNIVNTYDLSLHFQVSPNPSEGIVYVLHGNSVQESTVSLFDLSGRIVLQSKQLNTDGSVDLRDFSKGIYFLKLEQQHQTQIQKIVLY